MASLHHADIAVKTPRTLISSVNGYHDPDDLSAHIDGAPPEGLPQAKAKQEPGAVQSTLFDMGQTLRREVYH